MNAPAGLPPGPGAPAAWQTVEWVVRPTALLRRARARYGDAFTLRTFWADAPIVLVSSPGDVRRVFAAEPSVLGAGGSATPLEPFAGPSSILVLDGDEHLRHRRTMSEPFRGESVAVHRPLVRRLADEELDRWPAGEEIETLPRLRGLALEVILRVVFGARPGPEVDRLRAAIGHALGLASAWPRLAAMALVQRDLGPRSPYGAFTRAVRDVDALLYELIAERRLRPAGDGSVLDDLLAGGDDSQSPADREVRDQLVALLAAGHETTAASLSWAFERLARHPHVVERLREGERAYLEAVVNEVLRVRPVLSIAARRVLAPFDVAGHRLPAGVHVAACLYLAHRRAESWEEPTAFRPERWLDGRRPAHAWIPFGGGRRRCLGAAFASMELQEVLAAAVERFDLRPDRPRGERVRRRSVTLTPARGGRVVVVPR